MNSDTLSVTGPHAALYQRVVDQALTRSDQVMQAVVEGTRRRLQLREDQAHTVGERHALIEARRQLNKLEAVMCERYPGALRQAFSEGTARDHTRSLFSVGFDELELMDESQVSESVERARAQQLVVTAAEVALADLNALICAAQGLPNVDPARNPLRPELYVQAMQTVVSQMQVSHLVRRDWMWHMAEALGSALRAFYLDLIGKFQQGGVKPAGYAVRQTGGAYVHVGGAGAGQATPGFEPEAGPGRPEASASVSASARRGEPGGGASAQAPGGQRPAPSPAAAVRCARDESLLTLDRLRQLLAGELQDGVAPVTDETFAQRFSREFDANSPSWEPPAPDFEMTVPAAFEALKEMNQVDHMMQRLGSQHGGREAAGDQARSGASPSPGEALRRKANGLGQALSLEVVAMMVDNIARDSRLLAPVQRLVRDLEPALLQLALADPRFFSDREHPARRLLQEVTDRSLAFDSEQARGFATYLQPLMEIAQPLATAHIENEEPFAAALQQLLTAWGLRERERQQERERAVEALRRAEQRNLLAVKMAREIGLMPQISLVPSEVFSFLRGPWVQVMAQARMADTSGANDPGRYRELVDALLWSAQPELTRKNVGKLVRLVPKLLARLRDGLASIDYPATRTSAFFDLLMKLHQLAFKPGAPVASEDRTKRAIKERPKLDLRDDDDPWIAPSEAMESGFMESAVNDSQGPQAPGDSAHDMLTPSPPAPVDAGPVPVSAVGAMAIGTWVELLIAGKWERTQLSWASPHGTLFLFANSYGSTQSMTKRLLDKLLVEGAMRLISQQTVVQGALDAVAQVAMRNSVDVKL